MQRVRGVIGLSDETSRRWNGAGVAVAILDTGIIRHPDFDRRIYAFRDFVNHGKDNNCYDDSGHGTHVAGCLAGSGLVSNGKYAGVAPGCSLIIGKVLNEDGDGSVKSMVDGIDWIIAQKNYYRIRALNISVGVAKIEDEVYREQLLSALKRAWDSGLVVVVAAGNNGPAPMSISPMAVSDFVITVGCHDGDYKSDHLCEAYSGRGPSVTHVKKPDIVAPGTDIISCCARVRRNNKGIISAYNKKSGTSMATPLVTGAAALLLQKEPGLSNIQVRRRIHYCASDVGESWTKQGWGMLNVERLLFTS